MDCVVAYPVFASMGIQASRPTAGEAPADRLPPGGTAIPTPGPGQVLLRVQYLSLDPYMRGRMDDRKSYAPPAPLGGVMPGESVATVVASHDPGYSEGDIVLAQTGWRTHALSDRADLRKLDPAVAPVTTGLGVLGMPGFTAYGGLHVIGKPSSRGNRRRRGGERTGRVAGRPARQARRRQGGRHRGRPREVRVREGRTRLRRGGRSQGRRFRREAGGGLPRRHRRLLRERRRGGLAGGAAAAQQFARVPVSGLVAQYNAAGQGDGPDRLPATMREILSKSLTVRGFINYEFAAEHYAAFLREVGAGIADGRIRYREDFVDGLEKAPEAFIGMLEGRNFGKLIVRVDG